MKHYINKLENGIRVICVPIANMQSATLTVWIGTGSRSEEKKLGGISHFLEHMAFKGSKKRPTAKLIADTIDSIGAENNAGTSKEWTNFYIRARSAHLETAFDILSDIILRPILNDDDRRREEGVILEEIALYEDTPIMRIGDVFEQLIFKGNSLARDIIGIPVSVKSITKEDFVRYRNDHYYAKNMVVTVAGGVDRKKVLSLSQKYFEDVKTKRAEPISKFRSAQKTPGVLLYPKQKEQAHFILGFRGNKFGHKDRFKEAILGSILGGGMSSRLFTEIREKRGLAYAVKAGVDNYSDIGYFSAYVGVDPKRVDEAIKVTLEQFLGMAKGSLPITSDEVQRAKEYVKGHLALSLEDTRNINSFYGKRELFLDEIETPEYVFKEVDKVSKEDLMNLARKTFVNQGLNLALIGPYKSQARFEKLLK